MEPLLRRLNNLAHCGDWKTGRMAYLVCYPNLWSKKGTKGRPTRKCCGADKPAHRSGDGPRRLFPFDLASVGLDIWHFPYDSLPSISVGSCFTVTQDKQSPCKAWLAKKPCLKGSFLMVLNHGRRTPSLPFLMLFIQKIYIPPFLCSRWCIIKNKNNTTNKNE